MFGVYEFQSKFLNEELIIFKAFINLGNTLTASMYASSQTMPSKLNQLLKMTTEFHP